jgi:ribosomal 50S subunit-recycling heat shock protein
MRVDKFLKASRILKRRSISKELAQNQRVEINGRTVKPAHEVHAGDVVSITFGNRPHVDPRAVGGRGKAQEGCGGHV